MLLYDSTWPLDPRPCTAQDVNFLGVPGVRHVQPELSRFRERILMKNIAYAGALVAILNVDMAIVEELLLETFSNQEGAARIQSSRAEPWL